MKTKIIEKKTLIELIAEKNELFQAFREERIKSYYDANGARVSGFGDEETSRHYIEDVEKAFGRIDLKAINTIVEFMLHTDYRENYHRIKLSKIYRKLRNLDKDYCKGDVTKETVKYNLLLDKEKLETDYFNIYQCRI